MYYYHVADIEDGLCNIANELDRIANSLELIASTRPGASDLKDANELINILQTSIDKNEDIAANKIKDLRSKLTKEKRESKKLSNIVDTLKDSEIGRE